MTATISLITIACVIFIIYRYRLDKQRYQNNKYLLNLQEASAFLESIREVDDYITWMHREKLKSSYAGVGKFFQNKTRYYKEQPLVAEFNAIFNDLDSYVERQNSNYIRSQKEKLEGYFDDIEGKKLDDQQRSAVIIDEYSNLIIAGAGSGKTLTILGKVKYLIEQKNIKPEDILLLSFTKKTVDELNQRLKNIGLDTRAKTFHKLGYEIIKQNLKSVPVLTNENTLANLVKSYLEDDIFRNAKALEAFVLYVACYMNTPEPNDSYESLGEKLDREKGVDFQTLKSKCQPDELNKIAKAKLDTVQGEKVKSIEELTIANFLYINGIEYEYEKAYPFGDIVYRPDFYLTEYNIYLEHFGVDENNRAEWLTALNEEKYVKEMQLKRETHQTHNTKLLETYSYYNRDRVLIDKLTEMLRKEQVEFKPRDTKDIYAKVIEKDANFGSEIINLIVTFINLCKSRNLSYEQIAALFSDAKRADNKYMLERQELFLKFALPILRYYDKTLQEKGEIDYNDMINRATEIIITNKPESSYTHIIVDEYQDISYSRFNLIQQIRNSSGARLVCVGDDWQSIYRFAGSDISLFSNFGNYVGKFEQLFIEQTYRNSQALIDISSNYILKNRKQIIKRPRSIKEPLENPIQFVYYESEEAEKALIQTIETFKNAYGTKPILVLGRHSFDINDYIKRKPNSKIKYNEWTNKIEVQGFEDMEINFITVHKSKGLEAENVIVLNLRNHLLGFPNKVTDDPMLSLLLSEQEDYEFAEERRLLYVALTRTKNEVVLLIPTDVSQFAEELQKDCDAAEQLKLENAGKISCPYCQTGHLIIRRNANPTSQFLGCSNYPGCKQTFKNVEILDNPVLCETCKSGFMIKRRGQYSDFLGCTNYPSCKGTAVLEQPISAVV